jgi:hypothetical protein
MPPAAGLPFEKKKSPVLFNGAGPDKNDKTALFLVENALHG